MLLRIVIAFLARLSPARINDALAWNTFIGDYGYRRLQDVDTAYLHEYLAYWYCGEVYNGGHLQYFLNKHDHPWEEAAKGMEEMGAIDHARILWEAIARWRARERIAPTTAEEYLAIEKLSEFGDLDNAMYALEPHLEDYVERSIIAKRRRRPAAQPAH